MIFAPIRLAIRLVSLAITGAIVYLIISGVQVVTASRTTTDPTNVGAASAIVVLGSPAARSGSSADLRARLSWAARLYAAGRASKVAVATSGSGGSVAGNSELVGALRGAGVPTSSIVQLSASGPSSELSAARRQFGDGARVIVVTDAIDALWTSGAATGDGLKPEVSSPPSSHKIVFSEAGQLWKEASGVAVGRAIGFGRATWAAS